MTNMFSYLDKDRRKKSVERKELIIHRKVARSSYLFRLGFKSITTVAKVCEAFPELDMVNHTNRARLVRAKDMRIFFKISIRFLQSEMIRASGLIRDENFRPIEGKFTPFISIGI